MKTIIVIFSFLAFIAAVRSKPTDNEELLSELKKVLEERYEERKSQREVGSTDGSSTSGTDGTGGSDGTGGTGGAESDADEIEKLEEQFQQQEQNAGEEQQQGEEEEIEEAEQELENGEGEGNEEEEEEEEEEEQQLDEENENGDSESDTSDVKSMLEKGWNMLNGLQRVAVALHLENNPIKDNKSPREALHDVLTQMFQFDGLAQRVIRELLHSFSPEKDVCSQMFSDGEERTLERVTNCFIMRFTQLLSLIEHLQKVSSVEELTVKDLVRLTTLERDMLAASYEVYKILKKEDPTVSLSDFLSGQLSGLLSTEGANTNPSETETVDDSTGTGVSEGTQGQGSDSPSEGTGGTDEGSSSTAGTGSDTTNPAGDAGNTEGQEGSSTSKRVVKEDLLDRLAKKLEELLHKRP